jgi:hypothetical protein
MDDATDQAPDQPGAVTDPADRSLVEDLRRLAGDARTMAGAELAYQQARAKLASSSIAGIAGRAAVALALAFFALMAIVLGAILALSPLLTPWGATAVVTLVLLVGALVMALRARAKWRRMVARVVREDEPR